MISFPSHFSLFSLWDSGWMIWLLRQHKSNTDTDHVSFGFIFWEVCSHSVFPFLLLYYCCCCCCCYCFFFAYLYLTDHQSSQHKVSPWTEPCYLHEIPRLVDSWHIHTHWSSDKQNPTKPTKKQLSEDLLLTLSLLQTVQALTVNIYSKRTPTKLN